MLAILMNYGAVVDLQILALMKLPHTNVTLVAQRVAVNFTGQRTMLHYYHLAHKHADVVKLVSQA